VEKGGYSHYIVPCIYGLPNSLIRGFAFSTEHYFFTYFYPIISVCCKIVAENAKKVLDIVFRLVYLDCNRNRKAPAWQQPDKGKTSTLIRRIDTMNMVQALSIICPEEKTEMGLKKAYRAACLKHHPDKGGSLEIMKLVNAAYDFLKNCDTWWTGEQARAAKKTTPLTDTMQKMIDKLVNLPGLKIEIIGSWLWVSGMTYAHKDLLKSLKMRFSGNKKAWYYHEDDYRKKGKKQFDMNEIREMHGSETIKNNMHRTIAA
jgi:hypothetical protein